MKRDNGIYGFRGDYYFLSNMAPGRVVYKGRDYKTVEHAYQSAKTTDLELLKRIYKEPSPYQVKKMMKRVYLPDGWDTLKLEVMELLVRQKFSYGINKQKLLETGDRYIEETNNWGDTFWGVCKGVGENHLGKILMKTRGDL